MPAGAVYLRRVTNEPRQRSWHQGGALDNTSAAAFFSKPISFFRQ